MQISIISALILAMFSLLLLPPVELCSDMHLWHLNMVDLHYLRRL